MNTVNDVVDLLTIIWLCPHLQTNTSSRYYRELPSQAGAVIATMEQHQPRENGIIDLKSQLKQDVQDSFCNLIEWLENQQDETIQNILNRYSQRIKF